MMLSLYTDWRPVPVCLVEPPMTLLIIIAEDNKNISNSAVNIPINSVYRYINMSMEIQLLYYYTYR